MDLGLNGKVVLITGATGGIGEATAKAFSGAGAKVVINYNSNGSGAESLARSLRTESIAIKVDVSDEVEVASLFSKALAKFGTIDVVVANSGIFPPEDLTIDRMSLERFEKVMEVNAKGAWLVCREFFRLLRSKSPKSASIVLVGSTSAFFGECGHSEYSMSKAALHGLMLTLKNEIVQILPNGRVNAVAPGWIWTPMTEEFKNDEAAIKNALKTRSLRRIGRPQEVAKVILALASEEISGYVTGQVLRVDGGMEGRVLWDDSEIDVSHA